MDGVQDVEVNYDKKEAIVTGRNVDPKSLIQALDKAGYKGSQIKKAGTTDSADDADASME